MKTTFVLLLYAAFMVVCVTLLTIFPHLHGPGFAYKAASQAEPESSQVEAAASVEPVVAKTSYIFAGKRLAELEGGKLTYFNDDNLGSHSVITDASGIMVSEFRNLPFGETKVSSNSHYQYTGKERDSTGLYYYGARYYNPNIGRFTQVDPILRTDSNFAYVKNNPMILIDPKGEQMESLDPPTEADQLAQQAFFKSLANHYNLVAMAQGVLTMMAAANDPGGPASITLVQGILSIPSAIKNDFSAIGNPDPKIAGAGAGSLFGRGIDAALTIYGVKAVSNLARSQVAAPYKGKLLTEVDDPAAYISDVSSCKMLRFVDDGEAAYAVPTTANHIDEYARIAGKDVEYLLEHREAIPGNVHGGALIIDNNEITAVATGLSSVETGTLTPYQAWMIDSRIVEAYDPLSKAGLILNHPKYLNFIKDK